MDVNFHLKKSLEIFDKNSVDKIWSKMDKEIKVSPLMPIRVNAFVYFAKAVISWAVLLEQYAQYIWFLP